jgi:RNA polymerase primary sigma factor
MNPVNPYICGLSSIPLLTAEEEHELAVRVAAGESAARDHMLRSNLRLVVSIAKHFTGKGLSLEDLIGEGNLGLFRALEGFDPSYGTRFGTYATRCIKHAICNAIAKYSRLIRVPDCTRRRALKWRRAAANMTGQLGRIPTHQEVAANIGLPEKCIPRILEALRAFEFVQHNRGTNDDDATEEIMVDNHELLPGDELERFEDLRKATEMIKELNQREAAVIRMRYGLDGQEPQQLKEIGKVIGTTKERVRQIEQGALQKLREKMAS